MKESFISWNEYTFVFTEKARSYNLEKDSIDLLLNYAKSLSENKLPIIYDLQHLAYLTEFRLTYIKRAISRPGSFYRYFDIPKKNGHTRNISEPLPGLKQIQYWIVQRILSQQSPNKLNNAYSLGKSIKTNAKYHTKQEIVLNIDIQDYFQSINTKKVSNFFSSIGYTEKVSNSLASLCTLENGLPQGSPSSPVLSNLLTKDLDVEIFDFCRSIQCRYSRYADDITISGNFDVEFVINKVREILFANDFKINDKKIRAKRQYQRQMVTGIVVNKRLSIKKYNLRKIRQEIFHIKTKGLEDHLIWIGENKKNYLTHLVGQLNFYLFIRPENPEMQQYKEYLFSLIENQNPL